MFIVCIRFHFQRVFITPETGYKNILLTKDKEIYGASFSFRYIFLEGQVAHMFSDLVQVQYGP